MDVREVLLGDMYMVFNWYLVLNSTSQSFVFQYFGNMRYIGLIAGANSLTE